jgi:hypothetical protein
MNNPRGADWKTGQEYARLRCLNLGDWILCVRPLSARAISHSGFHCASGLDARRWRSLPLSTGHAGEPGAVSTARRRSGRIGGFGSSAFNFHSKEKFFDRLFGRSKGKPSGRWRSHAYRHGNPRQTVLHPYRLMDAVCAASRRARASSRSRASSTMTSDAGSWRG